MSPSYIECAAQKASITTEKYKAVDCPVLEQVTDRASVKDDNVHKYEETEWFWKHMGSGKRKEGRNGTFGDECSPVHSAQLLGTGQ